jgi:outer membrane receptor protein involved in Fe transport
MTYRHVALAFLVSAAAGFATQELSAQTAENTTRIEEILVWGRATQLLGTADSASQGVVGYDDFSTRPLSRVAELVEVVPGMIATQHSGPGKANQYFLRGINLDHGSDFSTFVDGMPVNFRTHGHAQGYMDLNFIIPEIIERVNFQKGPYFADTGDFSLAGSSAMKTYDVLDDGFSELTFGSQDELRFVTADSFSLADGDMLYAFEHQQTNGHFDLDQDVRKYNGFLKYSGLIAGFQSRITFTGYDSQWTSTNQVPQRAVDNGLISRFGYIDPDLGGESHRYSLSGNFEMDDWDLGIYASSYYMSLINNPTYFLNDPINGDEFEQEDERWLIGGSLRHRVDIELFGMSVTRTVGTDIRYDDVNELNLFNTISTQRVGSIREDEAEEFSIGAFGELQFSLSDQLRATVGVRADYYDFEVGALRQANSGSGNDSLWQPNIGLAYRLNKMIEFYANYGHGFHSNDVRAAVNKVDPISGTPTDAQDVLVEGKGSEFGFRYDTLNGFNISFSAFALEMDSELVFVGDAGTTEPSDPTRRRGVELNSFYEISEGLVFDFSAAKTSGHFIGLPSNADSIPDAHEEVLAAGLTFTRRNGLTASIRLRHFSDAALTEDETVRKDGSTLVHAGASYSFDNWEVGVDILNLLDSEDDDIAYFFESRLKNEALGAEDTHFHPSNPRTIRVLLKYKF